MSCFDEFITYHVQRDENPSVYAQHFVRSRVMLRIGHTTLSVFRPGNLPRGLPEVHNYGGAHRDQELKGET
jgi:hypothetical protein